MDLNGQDLARLVANRVDGLSQQLATAALQAALDEIAQTLTQGGKVRLQEFGTFSSRHRLGRRILHPRTREPLDLPARCVPIFVPASSLCARVAGPL
ncbi:HU family DNA-binding protein [Candidatus Cyanaurora vandensis]|uniref:HU family DNA-binding protein n=1 Tax=Candidatus Cyanaurora vandensis TaxID=2714958 RepID=UPI00257F35A7|nr:HU family DNA-binding protein [Candidatus Cyanaurora vandensis]